MVVITKKLEKLIERVILLYFYMPLITFFTEDSENTNKKLATKNMWLIHHCLCGSSVLLFSTKN